MKQAFGCLIYRSCFTYQPFWLVYEAPVQEALFQETSFWLLHLMVNRYMRPYCNCNLPIAFTQPSFWVFSVSVKSYRFSFCPRSQALFICSLCLSAGALCVFLCQQINIVGKVNYPNYIHKPIQRTNHNTNQFSNSKSPKWLPVNNRCRIPTQRSILSSNHTISPSSMRQI